MNTIYAITPVNLSLEKIISKTSNLLELGIKTYQYRDKTVSYTHLTLPTR